MSRATELRINRLRIEGRTLSATDVRQLARLIAVELAKAPLVNRGIERLLVEPRPSGSKPQSLERLAAQVARDIHRSLN